MARKNIPKGTSDKVMKEYSHKCAICDQGHPHLHHIDENPSNNHPENLIPLCPNHHLNDQHGPGIRIPINRLKMFRQYKEKRILNPKFDIYFSKLEFLFQVNEGEEDVKELEKNAEHFIELCRNLKMGSYLAKEIEELIGPLKYAWRVRLDGRPDPQNFHKKPKKNAEYRRKLIENRNNVQSILVEILKHQDW